MGKEDSHKKELVMNIVLVEYTNDVCDTTADVFHSLDSFIDWAEDLCDEDEFETLRDLVRAQPPVGEGMSFTVLVNPPKAFTIFPNYKVI